MSILQDFLEGDGFHLSKHAKGELCSPCPDCGGTDRFIYFIDKDKFWCRQCHRSGDAIDYLMWIKGLKYPEAKRLVGDNGQPASIPPGQTSEKKNTSSPSSRGKIMATFEYHDESGQVVYRACRWEPGKKGRTKDFTLQRPKDRGGWADGIKGIQRVLYRLPDLIRADSVYLVEGEGVTDALVGIGIEATSTPGGAGMIKSLLPDILNPLESMQVFILPDNDEPGREYAHALANSLHGKAKVSVIKLPGLPEKGDAADFIKMHGPEKAASLLVDLSEAAEPWTPSRVKVDSGESAAQPALSFPDIMSGAAGAFTELFSAHLEPPPHFFYLGYLTCLGSVLAGKVTLASEIAPQPRLYTLLLGESDDVRKSTVLNISNSFFKDALDEFSVCWGVGSAEGLQKRLEASRNVLLCLDEFKLFVSKCRYEGSVLLPCVNTLFESNRFESQTKKAHIKLDQARLSILAASTIQTYERTWHSSFTDIGFNNRLFIVPGSGERKFSIPKKVPDEEKLKLKRSLGELLRNIGEDLELDISPAGRELFDAWYMGLERSIHAKRLDTYALRFMILLSVNDLKSEVDEETVQKAIALADWQFKVRRLYDPIDADSKIAKVEERLRRVLATGPKTDRELQRAVNTSRVGLWCYDRARKNLQQYNEIAWNGKEERWKINDV